MTVPPLATTDSPPTKPLGKVRAYILRIAGLSTTAQKVLRICNEPNTCANDLNRITPRLIAEAALAGDAVAQEIYEKAGFYLGIAAANMCVAIGPRRIIIGGGVAQAGELLLDPIRHTMRANVHVMPVEQVEVVPAQLGNNAGVIGVASWAAQA